MDLMQIVRENANARKIILDQNPAVSAKKYGITLGQALKLQNYAAMLEAAKLHSERLTALDN